MSRINRVGLGTDIHRLVEGRPLFLGTVEIPHTHGLSGHSDADSLAHAIADALLGAAGCGEIGTVFPNDDPKWEGLSGAALLGHVADRLDESGWSVINIDSVVTAERPRLAPYRDAMVSGIAVALRIDRSSVSVKIKSNEQLGTIGRGEGIAAQAVALVEKTKSA